MHDAAALNAALSWQPAGRVEGSAPTHVVQIESAAHALPWSQHFTTAHASHAFFCLPKTPQTTAPPSLAVCASDPASAPPSPVTSTGSHATAESVTRSPARTVRGIAATFPRPRPAVNP